MIRPLTIGRIIAPTSLHVLRLAFAERRIVIIKQTHGSSSLVHGWVNLNAFDPNDGLQVDVKLPHGIIPFEASLAIHEVDVLQRFVEVIKHRSDM